MKNFPHQFNDLTKLTAALNVVSVLHGQKEDVDDDGVFGQALAEGGIYTFRNLTTSVADRIKLEAQKPLGSQGFRTAARDIRRFFRIADLIGDPGQNYPLTPRGKELLAAAGNAALRNALWREALLQLKLENEDGSHSHPYRILLRLVADRPGIDTGKLLLALEAVDDSQEEFARIIGLSALDYDEIVRRIGVGESNARNAVKILPAIAEQVGDIRRDRGRTYPTSVVISTEDEMFQEVDESYGADDPVLPNAVSPEDISAIPNFSGTPGASFDLTAAIQMRKKRTVEHHLAVQSIAALANGAGFNTYENPYDCLAFDDARGGLLIEVKTLDGSRADERRQSEKALGQLRGYRHFNLPADVKRHPIIDIIAYASPPSPGIVQFAQANSIKPTWLDGDHWLTNGADGNTTDFRPERVLAEGG